MEDSLLNQAMDFIKTKPLDISQDQFFLINCSIIKKLVATAQISSNDRVLEVGPGLGFLTKELAQKAKEVLAIEIDERFKPFLQRLPQNVQVIYGNAYKLLNRKDFLNKTPRVDKTVSCIPYSQAQNMLHNYTNWPWYQEDLVWMAPLSLAEKVNQEPILGAYFQAQVKQTVPKTAFYPQPNTTSAIVYFKRLADPIQSGDFEIFFRRWLYNHEHLKVKNAVREGIINAAKNLKGKFVSKNQARDLIDHLNIPLTEQEKLTNNIRPEYYFEIPKKLNNWFNQLARKTN